MHEHLAHFLTRTGHWGYLVVFICVTLECAAVFFLPAESLVVIGGFLAARGTFDLGEFLAVVLTGAILGPSLGFNLGRTLGRPRLIHYGRWIGWNERYFKRVDAFFERYGGAAVFLGRFTSFMRPFVSLAAGFTDMPFRRFFCFNAAGGILWSVGFTLLGYFLGENWVQVERMLGRSSVVVILIVIAVGGVVWLRREK